MSDIIPEILTRGVTQVLPDSKSLAELMQLKKIKLYLGIDPTGAFLTLGHMVLLKKLQQFAAAGHEVILLIGNGTVKIGDPTGRDDTRPMLTDQQIEENFKEWQQQASRVLDFSKITIQHNGDWLDKLTFSEIVQLLAKTTAQQLLERDMFQDRISSGLPIHGHELIYPLIQGYDSVAMDVDLEIGGNDQMFNMMMGRTLQKAYNDKEKWCLTTDLLLGTDGRKMSKSYNNYIALTDEPNEIYGKIMSIKDELIESYFTLLTDLPLSEIESMKQAMAAGENPMEFKKKLAFMLTAQLHDKASAEAAAEHFEKTVQKSELPAEIPSVKLQNTSPQPAIDILQACEPNQSKGNHKRLIEQGGVTLLPQNERLSSFDQELDPAQLDIIKIGKRSFYKIMT